MMRLDKLLMQQGLAPSRAKAQAMIAADEIFLYETLLTKPAALFPFETPLARRAKKRDYVARSAHKLLHGLEHFRIHPAGCVCLDLGASTGGFSQVLLEQGAARVYAVDVGHGQLHASLQADPRLVSLERTNARTLNRALIPEAPSLIVCDVSFISLKQALPAALALAAPKAALLALVKPQFEAGRERLGYSPVIKDAALQQTICDEMVAWLNGFLAWAVIGVVESPILGGEGTQEFLLAARHIE